MSEDRIIPNSFQTPNLYIDRAMQHLTDAELRCLIFATRHILGWQDTIVTRQNTISLSMFENGYSWKRKDGTVYKCGGCGLNRTAISKAVNSLCAFGLLEKVGEATLDGQTYHIGENPKWEVLEQRSAEKREKNCKRVSKATAVIVSKRGGTSDVPVSSDGNSTGTSDVPKQTHIQTQEEIAAPQADAGSPPKIVQFPTPDEPAKPAKAKRERDPDPLFDAVKEYVFGIEGEAEGGRIAIISTWLAGKNDGKRSKVGKISKAAEPQHVKMFAEWCERKGYNVPHDLVKFVENWRKWATEMNGSLKAKSPLAGLQIVTNDDGEAKSA